MMSRERLTTTAMASDGRAIARRESGQVVFVEGALPNETVTVETLYERARYASARVVTVVEPAAERSVPPCPHVAEGCGGCQWQHITPAGQLALKSSIITDALRRIGHLADVPIRSPVELDPWHWRTTIRAAARDGQAAFRKARSHDLVPVDGCLIAHPLLLELLSGRRYPGASSVVLRCGARTGERLASPSPADAPIDVPSDVRPDHFHEEAAGRRWRISARSFFQSRPDGADALANLVRGAAEDLRERMDRAGPHRAVDAYSGVGLFAGTLASAGWTVTAVEGSRQSASDAGHNLSDLPVDVVAADVTGWTPVPADLVVADPSRSGLGPGGVSVLSATGALRLILISCDVASLARDAALLVRAGYRLTSVMPVDMFAQSWRVEVVSLFDRFPGRGDLL